MQSMNTRPRQGHAYGAVEFWCPTAIAATVSNEVLTGPPARAGVP